MGDPRHEIGRWAERQVAEWLEAHDWRVLAERYRSTGGEIDLLALDATGCLVGVEVKIRRSVRTGEPVEAVSPRAVRRRRAALGEYARATRIGHRGLRVDVVTVSPGPEPGSWRLARLAGVDAW
jgi:putative endonuclease